MRTKRKPVVGLSLKMYQTTLAETIPFTHRLIREAGGLAVEQFFCPSLGLMWPVAKVLKGTKIGLGTQNMAPNANGAYTGEFSIESLVEMGGQYIEIGHCERRGHFRESGEQIRQKVSLALDYGLTPVLCIGEKEKSSSTSERYQFLYRQLFLALQFQSTKRVSKVIIAYEPVWAIGKTLAASSRHVHQTHQLIRKILGEIVTPAIAEQIRIIYGGSVSQENVTLLIDHPDVDGVFVGRFGHDPTRYQSIVKAVANKAQALRE